MSTPTVTPPPPQAAPPAAAPRMTPEEFGLRYADKPVEYVNGEVKEVTLPAGGRHGKVCNWVAFYLTLHARELGHIFINDTFLHTPTKGDPERVYAPDVFFVAYDRLPKEAEVPVSTVMAVPDLVVEVRSPSDDWTDAIGKMLDYLRAGVTVAMILDPKTRSASVFRTGDRHEIFEAERQLTLPDVLPGFSVPVAALFA